MKVFGMEFSFDTPALPAAESVERIVIDGREVPLTFQRNNRARRYRLSLDRDGSPRVTIPRAGSKREAQAFVARQARWLAAQLRRFAALPPRGAAWGNGTEIYYRGQLVALSFDRAPAPPAVQLGTVTVIPLPLGFEAGTDLRPVVENHLWTLAEVELRTRAVELAKHHGVAIARVTVRAQVSRWGSSSRAGTISLNWRLIQTPDEVRDYVIVHELMHQREMNHSARFWALVEAACPPHESCRRWLKEHGVRIL